MAGSENALRRILKEIGSSLSPEDVGTLITVLDAEQVIEGKQKQLTENSYPALVILNNYRKNLLDSGSNGNNYGRFSSPLYVLMDGWGANSNQDEEADFFKDSEFLEIFANYASLRYPFKENGAKPPKKEEINAAECPSSNKYKRGEKGDIYELIILNALKNGLKGNKHISEIFDEIDEEGSLTMTPGYVSFVKTGLKKDGLISKEGLTEKGDEKIKELMNTYSGKAGIYLAKTEELRGKMGIKKAMVAEKTEEKPHSEHKKTPEVLSQEPEPDFKYVLENDRNLQIMDKDGRYIDLLFLPYGKTGDAKPKRSYLHSAFLALELIKHEKVTRKDFENYLENAVKEYGLKKRALEAVKIERGLVEEGYEEVLKLSKDGARLLKEAETGLYMKAPESSDAFDATDSIFSHKEFGNIRVPAASAIVDTINDYTMYLKKAEEANQRRLNRRAERAEVPQQNISKAQIKDTGTRIDVTMGNENRAVVIGRNLTVAGKTIIRALDRISDTGSIRDEMEVKDPLFKNEISELKQLFLHYSIITEENNNGNISLNLADDGRNLRARLYDFVPLKDPVIDREPYWRYIESITSNAQIA